MDRRSFLKTIAAVAVFAGASPLRAVAQALAPKLPKPNHREPLRPGWMRVRRSLDHREIDLLQGDVKAVEAFSRGGNAYLVATRSQDSMLEQPIAASQPRVFPNAQQPSGVCFFGRSDPITLYGDETRAGFGFGVHMIGVAPSMFDDADIVHDQSGNSTHMGRGHA